MKTNIEKLKSQTCSTSAQEEKYKKAKEKAKEKLDKARRECKEIFGADYANHF